MPPYRLPTLKSTALHMWGRGAMFIKKAGTIIFAGVVIIWFLSAYPTGDIEGSYIAAIGHALEPIFAPLGWSWRAVVALFFGFVAKEVVVGTFGVLYGVGEDEGAIAPALQNEFSPLSAYAYMAFLLIYTPCVATLATIYSETRSKKLVLFTLLYELALAYIVALAIVKIGGLIL